MEKVAFIALELRKRPLLSCFPLLLFIPPLFRLLLFFCPLLCSTALCLLALLRFLSYKESVSHAESGFEAHPYDFSPAGWQETDIAKVPIINNVKEGHAEEEEEEHNIDQVSSSIHGEKCEVSSNLIDEVDSISKVDIKEEEVGNCNSMKNATSEKLLAPLQRYGEWEERVCHRWVSGPCGLQEDMYSHEMVRGFDPWEPNILA